MHPSIGIRIMGSCGVMEGHMGLLAGGCSVCRWVTLDKMTIDKEGPFWLDTYAGRGEGRVMVVGWCGVQVVVVERCRAYPESHRL